jgi:prenyltransferase beta subunit
VQTRVRGADGTTSGTITHGDSSSVCPKGITSISGVELAGTDLHELTEWVQQVSEGGIQFGRAARLLDGCRVPLF